MSSMRAITDNSLTVDSNHPIQKNPDLLSFWVRSKAFQGRRTIKELWRGQPRRFSKADELRNATIIAESQTPLWNRNEASEHLLVMGKIQNLRLAIQKLNGLEVEANEVFSFWTHIGRASRRKGYVAGRELREGCLVPSVGGGLCQLSNALYDAALQADFEIVERHAHTKIIPGSLAESGRDATVFWNYVDLRFKANHRYRIEAELTSDSLVLRYKAATHQGRSSSLPVTSNNADSIGSCFSCGQSTCSRHPKSVHLPPPKTAYLLDEYWPEFDRYITSIRSSHDTLFIPIAGKLFGKTNYEWTTDGYGMTKQAILTALFRAYRTRTAGSGGDRQRIALECNERLARDFASEVSYEHTHLVIMQNLLPYLWRDGHLQGRTFDVLMTGLPLKVLHQRLDQAVSKHPESSTLGDFRASDLLLQYEHEALKRARKLITPHSEVATFFPQKTELLNWVIPNSDSSTRRLPERLTFVFPASTLGRKGAYELREVLKEFDAELVLSGPILEDKNFWHGFSIKTCSDNSWALQATAVVLPSVVEGRPRKLLQAVAAGIPVIASAACGLRHVEGVTTFRTGDIDALRAAVSSVVERWILDRQLFTQQQSLIPHNVIYLNEIAFGSQFDHC